MPIADRYAFGDFVLERSQRRVLRRDGTALELAPRLFGALLLFIEQAGRLLDKDTLILALWPGVVVEENNLSQIVFGLRSALGDDARARRYIETVPRHGFRFVAPVQALDDDADPPAAAAPSRTSKGNLMPLDARLFGREADLRAVSALLDAHAVVSIVGAGGIGKTRLGLAAATAMQADFPDGVWWIELAAVTDAALLPTVIAIALGMQLPTGRPALDALARALRDQQVLLVLDNCEQFVIAVAGLVDALHAAATGVHFLVTSQEPLKTADEHVYRVGALALPADSSLAAAVNSAAVALFVERAAAAEARFALRAENAQAVVDVCYHLDGIPLALELAAARVPLLGIDGLRSKLDQRFKLLTGGKRSSPLRQKTLRNALEWSCALLSAEERAVLRRLGGFAGSFTLEAAQRVVVDEAVDEWLAIDLLGQLVDKSLVVVEPGAARRYRLLETTRAYALELLDAAGETQRRRRRQREPVNALAVRDWSVGDDGDRTAAQSRLMRSTWPPSGKACGIGPGTMPKLVT